ncbi:MAG: hypothetical protein SPL41_08550 [Succinivibrionaceae bacterium]|nr:hypothetical protein [Succinivibrionaceae bacterium]
MELNINRKCFTVLHLRVVVGVLQQLIDEDLLAACGKLRLQGVDHPDGSLAVAGAAFADGVMKLLDNAFRGHTLYSSCLVDRKDIVVMLFIGLFQKPAELIVGTVLNPCNLPRLEWDRIDFQAIRQNKL